ncbi:MAG: phenylalanine--tRNA ligase subunit alpha [Opitutales bacterium]|nr:phenylalanine--tRNA ligase subunit alpha [Opitutales bacterium]
MDQDIQTILSKANSEAPSIESRGAYEGFKATFVGPQGSFTGLRRQMGKLPKEDKPVFGKKINELKQQLESIFAEVEERLEVQELAAKVGPAIDPTLPTTDGNLGTRHPISQIMERIVHVFEKVGFTVASGSELETEFYCFDALNTPPEHPARAEQDTYYMPHEATFSNIPQKEQERYVMRPHTSSVQIRTMLKEGVPLRILSPGRTFRRDTADATHSANFHQIEGLYVGKNVTVTDLKAILDYFAREMLGAGAKVRFRPHFFPYTEPSFEVDFSAEHLGKIGKQWIEIMGCGMVDPKVFEAVGVDPEEYSGYAFGMGIERIAMIATGVDDIRYFYQNDMRFLRQFA